MTESELKQLYTDNPDYQAYVDKCRQYDGRSVDEELKLRTIKEVGEYYETKNQKTIKD